MTSKHKLPNSRHCFACGLENPIGLKLEFYADEEGGVVGEYSIPRQFEGYPGIAHGGIVTTILDEVLTRVFLVEDHNRLMYTGKITTRLRQHVPVEEPLRLSGHAVRDRGRTGEAVAQIRNAAGETLAEAEALMVALKPGELDQHDLRGLGWQVYPDKAEEA
jgi:acyl-coenzyme A thioesterase PaaI-like protein